MHARVRCVCSPQGRKLTNKLLTLFQLLKQIAKLPKMTGLSLVLPKLGERHRRDEVCRVRETRKTFKEKPVWTKAQIRENSLPGKWLTAQCFDKNRAGHRTAGPPTHHAHKECPLS